ncbi:MAG: hypothetical protein MI861_11410, partial [Pirellulales bacterium]|nr:hypothetical protein [Pirellulales bacterium]
MNQRDAVRSKKLDSRWLRVCREFLKCHRRPINVSFHLLTTPLGILGLLSLLNLVHPALPPVLAVVYLFTLWPVVPKPALLASAVVMAGLSAAAWAVSLDSIAAIACLIVGYLGQDLAHWITGEPTLQSTYRRDSDRGTRWIEHTVLLLPVLLTIAGRRRQSPLRILIARQSLLATRLTTAAQLNDLDKIRDWVRTSQPELTQSSHWWQAELPELPREAFGRLSHDATLLAMIRRFHGPGYQVRPVLGMNELYVTGPPKQSTSDTVFYMGHV